MLVGNGQAVSVKTAFGTYVEKRAVTGVLAGDTFEVVRVCSTDEWNEAEIEGREPITSAWPADDVRVMESA